MSWKPLQLAAVLAAGVLGRSCTSCGGEHSGAPQINDASAGAGGAAATDAPVPIDVHTEYPAFADFDCAHAPVVRSCTDGWCEIPAGCFIYGSPENEWKRGLRNENQVRVTLTRSFRLQQHELTQREWIDLGLPNPSGLAANGSGGCLEPECPVGNVTWFEAVAFANLLSEREGLQDCYVLDGCSGKLGEGMACTSVAGTTSTIHDCPGYRLPTDAEWEYAVRAGTLATFYSGDIAVYAQEICGPDPNLERIAWYCYNAGQKTHPVGQKEPNAWGLFDMLGNAFEWVNDPAIYSSPDGPVGDPGALVEVARASTIRGGGFNAWSTLLRAAAKHEGSRSGHGPGGGFRLARTVVVK
jgi:formylglycine-generating enzyme required for sulfatase activity